MDVYSKSRNTGGPGKGDDDNRITDRKAYRANFDEIDWHRPTICPGCKNEIDPETCHCGETIGKHAYCDNHSPVPAGCTCFYATKN